MSVKWPRPICHMMTTRFRKMHRSCSCTDGQRSHMDEKLKAEHASESRV